MLDQRFMVGRVATVTTAAPNPTAQDVGMRTTGGLQTQGVSLGGMLTAQGAAVQGQLSLSLIMVGIVGLVALYWATRTAQGGG